MASFHKAYDWLIGTFWFFYNHKIIKMYHVLLLKQSFRFFYNHKIIKMYHVFLLKRSFRFYLTAWTSSSYFESQFDLITKKLNLFGFMANEQFRLTIFDLAFFKRWTQNSKNHLDFLTKLD